MILVKTENTLCCVCTSGFPDDQISWYFWKDEQTYLLFQNEPYYLCSPACVDKFQLTPLLYSPIAYTLRFDFKSNMPTDKEIAAARKMGLDAW